MRLEIQRSRLNCDVSSTRPTHRNRALRDGTAEPRRCDAMPLSFSAYGIRHAAHFSQRVCFCASNPRTAVRFVAGKCCTPSAIALAARACAPRVRLGVTAARN